MSKPEVNREEKTIFLVRALLLSVFGLFFLTLSFFCICISRPEWLLADKASVDSTHVQLSSSSVWVAPDLSTIPSTENGNLIRYGRELISNTAYYLGPQGSVQSISNGMDCQNCHLDGGTRPYAFNFSAVASTYPKFKARSGIIESIEKRVNDCLERSLNGKPLANDEREMRAIKAYIQWVGSSVPKQVTPSGAGLAPLPYLDRAADPIRGKVGYEQKCASCHGSDGEGLLDKNKRSWTNPPLWGAGSYNDGAGLFRLSLFAGYIKSNMPWGATWQNPTLTDEEAWDIAAYVNSMPRPKKDISKDWPDIAMKPVDHPYGKFADDFSEAQHKFGPFKPIEEARRKKVAVSLK